MQIGVAIQGISQIQMAIPGSGLESLFTAQAGEFGIAGLKDYIASTGQINVAGDVCRLVGIDHINL